MSLKPDTTTIKLNNGLHIPAIGLGTWKADEKNAAYNSVKTALQNGYRHIDTAAAYGNEAEVGQAIKDSGVPREEIFLTTKLWNANHKPEDMARAFKESLERLGTYIDLYLMHWPVPLDPNAPEDANSEDAAAVHENWTYLDTYREMQKLYKSSGKIKALGVSNFTLPKMKKLLSDPETVIKPTVNQIEMHPLLPQDRLVNYMRENDIYAQAYSPLGSNDPRLLKNETVLAIAKKLDIEPAQVLISWAVQRGTIVLPKSVTASRIISNLQTVTLPEADFKDLNNLSKTVGVIRTCDVPAWKAFLDDEP